MARRRRRSPASDAGASIIVGMLFAVGSLFILLLSAIAKLLAFILKFSWEVIKLLFTIIKNEISKENAKQHTSNFALYTMQEIDCMDGIAFEKCIAHLLKKEGYKNISLTKASGDYGVDIVAEKGGLIYAFQCKCYSENLGLKPIQEVYAGAPVYNATERVVITNRWFTPNAKKLACTLNVQLWDREKLDTIRKCNSNGIQQQSIPNEIDRDLEELIKLLPDKNKLAENEQKEKDEGK